MFSILPTVPKIFMQHRMLLFDIDASRSDLRPRGYSEPHFSYLNNSGRPEAQRIRDLLEQWFARFPTHAQAALRARFRKNHAVPHYSAFFELYLHELLVLAGYKVTVAGTDDPGAGEKKPDFIAQRSSEPEFYLKATLATDKPATEVSADARVHRLYDALNYKLDSPDYFVGLELYSKSRTDVPERKLLNFVKDFFRTIDRDECIQIFQNDGLAALPRRLFDNNGVVLAIYPIPKSDKARARSGIRSIGTVGPGEACIVDGDYALRTAVTKKATRYGELRKPYIVAVNAVNQDLEDIDIMNALLGRETVVINTIRKTPLFTREPNGAWAGPTGPVNTRVSAVLVVSLLTPWSIRAYSPIVYHNPWAKYPCPHVLPDIHSARVIGNQMRVIQARSAQQIFRLPETWPK